MKTKIKQWLRYWSLRFEWWTNEWILSEDVWTALDNDEYDKVDKAIKEAQAIWGTLDPELVRARALMGFTKDPVPLMPEDKI